MDRGSTEDLPGGTEFTMKEVKNDLLLSLVGKILYLDYYSEEMSFGLVCVCYFTKVLSMVDELESDRVVFSRKLYIGV